MTNATIATDIHQSLDVQRDFTAEVALNLVLGCYHLTDLTSLVVGPVTNLLVLVDTSLLQNLG